MKRWRLWVTLSLLGVLGWMDLSGWAQEKPDAARAATKGVELTPEEQREKQVMERFLSVVEKTPRRGTALDKVYGYHVERGTLEALVKQFQQRTKKDPTDGQAWM